MDEEKLFDRARKRAKKIWDEAGDKMIGAAFTSLLVEAVEDLIVKIEQLNKQSEKLEKTNIALQKAALFLGFFFLFFGLYQISQNFIISVVITLVAVAVVLAWIKKE